MEVPVFQEKPVVQHFLDIYHLTVYIQLVDSLFTVAFKQGVNED